MFDNNPLSNAGDLPVVLQEGVPRSQLFVPWHILAPVSQANSMARFTSAAWQISRNLEHFKWAAASRSGQRVDKSQCGWPTSSHSPGLQAVSQC